MGMAKPEKLAKDAQLRTLNFKKRFAHLPKRRRVGDQLVEVILSEREHS
jgi:hypothetical protein